jgi:translocator assembly and maintenance protein 41
MVDLIFVAENPLSWHTANIEINPKHYSFLRYLGSKAVTAVQNFGAAKIYFNTLVPVNNAVGIFLF